MYFIYSAEQAKFMEKAEKTLGRSFKVGTVISKGRKKYFTELSTSSTLRYSDSRIVAEGEESQFKYTLPEGV